VSYTITLTDEAYAALAATSAREGRTVEDLVYAALAERLATHGRAGAAEPSAFIKHMYEVGLIRAIPDRRPDTPEEEKELELPAQSIGPGKPASDMDFEDRGQR
jgi:hypothetical protein